VRGTLKISFFILLSILLIVLSSCTKDQDPLPSVTHPQGWNDVTAENFHGDKVEAVGSDFCASCHGVDYSGGESGVSCYTCHTNFPHPPNWAAPGSDQSHAAYIKSVYWDLDECKVCHGSDYKGGSSGVSCYTCHTQPGGPEACNTCHGNGAAPVTDLANWAPPKDLDDNLDTTDPGVGVHQLHLAPSVLTSAYDRDCSLCHPALSGFDDPKHINGTVDIEFSDVATWQGKVTPVYHADTYQCSNVYCHGNFTFRRDESSVVLAYLDSVMTGNNPELLWPSALSGATQCIVCHNLPPQGHIVVSNCSQCHSTVVDANYNIIDPARHINGEKD
jgi:hypothetical protein